MVCSCVDFVLLPLAWLVVLVISLSLLKFLLPLPLVFCLSLVSSIASHIFLYQKKPMKKKMGRNERGELNSHAA